MSASVEERDEPVEEQRGNRLRRWRPLAVLAWIGFLVALTVWSEGLPVNAATVVVVCMTGLAAFGLGHVSQRRLFLDFLPLVAVIFVYTYLRGIADGLGMPTHWLLAPHVDRAIFGVQPVVWLQNEMLRPTPVWWDVPPSLMYVSFFFLPWVIAAVLWPRDRAAFQRWTLRWVVMSLLGFACFAIAPTAPPWAAARCTVAQVSEHPTDPPCMSALPAHPQRTILGARAADTGLNPVLGRTTYRGLDLIHLHLASKALQSGDATVDLVAAVPSLHASGSMLMALFLWRRVRRRWRPLLAAYPLLMTWTVVYTGNHYVFDVLVGWALAALVMVGCGGAERLYRHRRDRRRERGHTGVAVTS